MQYIPCNSALLAQVTLFLTQKGTFLPKDLQKVRKSQQSLIRDGHHLQVRHHGQDGGDGGDGHHGCHGHGHQALYVDHSHQSHHG